jgi:hypothetical protein
MCSRILICQEGRLKSHPSFTSLLQNNLFRETVFSLLELVRKQENRDYRMESPFQQQGQWFVNNLLHTDEIPCIDSLKEKLKNNDAKFIEKLQYFDQCVPGSDSYWRNKRAELISCICHHVEQGNGSPSLFVTLSCIEYHWQDIEKLLNSRRRIAGDPPISLKSVT